MLRTAVSESFVSGQDFSRADKASLSFSSRLQPATQCARMKSDESFGDELSIAAAKADASHTTLTARLKSCPDTNRFMAPSSNHPAGSSQPFRLQAFFRLPTFRLASIAMLLFLTSCSRAPSFNILGSFFPAWLLCGLLGIVLTVIVRVIFQRTGFEKELSPLIVVYPCMALFFTFSIWLVFYS
jgi:hypothetical protein